jgi:hypothetical protein
MKSLSILLIIPIGVLAAWFLSPPKAYTIRCDGQFHNVLAKGYSYGSGGCVYLKDSLWLTTMIKCGCDYVGEAPKQAQAKSN